jgi:hypothetical protein
LQVDDFQDDVCIEQDTKSTHSQRLWQIEKRSEGQKAAQKGDLQNVEPPLDLQVVY